VRVVSGALMTLAAAACALGEIELRGGNIIDAPVESVTLGGVRVGGAAPRTIPWDRVKVVTGQMASEALEYAEISEAAWRARTRLARGDALLAEPLFEWLYALYMLEEGATAGLVAEGYTRCLLDRGAQAEAVAPWLDAVRLGETGDREGVLHPLLPPIFEGGEATRRLADSGLSSQHSGGAAHAIAWWYTEAALLDSGLSGQLATTRPGDTERDGEAGFLERLVRCRSRDGAERRRMRDELRGFVDREHGTWREAWARAALGRSLLMEDDAQSRSLGVIELLHVPARFSAEQPALASMALREAAAALERAGDPDGARRLLERAATIDPWRPAPASRESSTVAPSSARSTTLNPGRAMRP